MLLGFSTQRLIYLFMFVCVMRIRRAERQILQALHDAHRDGKRNLTLIEISGRARISPGYVRSCLLTMEIVELVSPGKTTWNGKRTWNIAEEGEKVLRGDEDEDSDKK